jgi:DNA-binding MarR family transcriptional regulator
MNTPSSSQLNPTLWRTCRVLSGHTRIRLLRQVFENPNRCVSEMARAAGIGESDASQELRRLQSRGLLQRQAVGGRVMYHPGADPQVSSAAPLLAALRKSMSLPPEQDEELLRIAKGLSHERRIGLARFFMEEYQTFSSLIAKGGLNPAALRRHLAPLREGGWIRRQGQALAFAPPHHPLARALVKLLETAFAGT